MYYYTLQLQISLRSVFRSAQKILYNTFVKTFLIYGPYGYSGQLIAERAVQQGLKPILAGRDETRLRAQAESLNLEYRAFSLDDTPALYAALRNVEGVLHCAGFRAHLPSNGGSLPGHRPAKGMLKQALRLVRSRTRPEAWIPNPVSCL